MILICNSELILISDPTPGRNQSKLWQSVQTISEELPPSRTSAEIIFNYEKPYYNSLLQELNKGVKDVCLGDTSWGPWSKGSWRGSWSTSTRWQTTLTTSSAMTTSCTSWEGTR